MIRIYVQATHSKFDFSEVEPDSLAGAMEVLTKKFRAENKNLRNDPRVRNGYMDAYENFYSEQYEILPTGLLPYVYAYFNKRGIKYEVIDLRKTVTVDKDFLHRLIKKEVVFYSKRKEEYGKEYRPRPYQIESILAIVKKKGGIIQLPTASGKGFIASLICRTYAKHKILFIFDSVDLIHQTYDALITKYGHDESEIAIIQGQNYIYNMHTSRIILLSMASYEHAFHIFSQVKVIVADECHTTGRSTTSQKIIYSCQNASIHIGLSATADCLDNPAEQLRLYAMLGPIIYRKEIVEHIKNKYISKLNVRICTVNMPETMQPKVTGSWTDIYERKCVTPAEIKRFMCELYPELDVLKSNKLYDKWRINGNVDEVDETIHRIISDWEGQGDDYSHIIERGQIILRKFLGRGDESTHYVFNDIRNDIIAKIAMEKNMRHVLIIYTRMEHGDELLKRIPNAILIHGQHSLKERKEAEEYLKQHQSAIVLASNIWSKGKDIPEIENFINAGGGVSQIQQIQKMGRAVRLSPESGKMIATIWDFYDTFSPMALKQSMRRKLTYERLHLNPILIEV